MMSKCFMRTLLALVMSSCCCVNDATGDEYPLGRWHQHFSGCSASRPQVAGAVTTESLPRLSDAIASNAAGNQPVVWMWHLCRQQHASAQDWSTAPCQANTSALAAASETKSIL